MPWKTKKLEKIVGEAKTHIHKEFDKRGLEIDCPVFIAEKNELLQAILDELNQRNYSKNAIKKLEEHFLPFVVGKYFTFKHEIWLLHGKGDNIETITHELLHSIQRCEPNREGIVNYLTYKITENAQYINPGLLADWQEIEDMISYTKIKEKLLNEGDCEDF